MLDTDRRLFSNLFTIEEAQKIEADALLAERLDAFVSRFGRLQDTVGDKLLPALLFALAEKTGPAIDNLDRAENFDLRPRQADLLALQYTLDLSHHAVSSGH